MKYESLEEYFVKLQNMLFLILLTPLLSFIYLLVGPLDEFGPLPGDEKYMVIIIVVIIAIADWLVMTLIFRRTVKKISTMVGLSLKLDRYYWATIIRYVINVVSCLLLAAGFYLTNSSIFIGLFGVAMILFFFAWPRPAKVCGDLKLKGDEREMVYYKKYNL